MKKPLILLAFLLAGCAGQQTETVTLANARGDKVKCGPYTYGAANMSMMTSQEEASIAMNSLRTCVSDYQRAGYQRIASPAN